MYRNTIISVLFIYKNGKIILHQKITLGVIEEIIIVSTLFLQYISKYVTQETEAEAAS